MKRIKLFEAFNNTDKVEKLNLVVFSWAIEKFIQKNDLVINTGPPHPGFDWYAQIYRLPIVNKKLNNSLYFTYSTDQGIQIYCAKKLLEYLKEMKLAEGVKHILKPNQRYDPLYFDKIVAKVLKQVIKKIFVDDKD
jgi:hypothetical protein